MLSAYASDLAAMTPAEFKQAIRASEGRIVLGETVVTAAPLIDGVSNAEMMAAFSCDLLLLNELDVFAPEIVGFYDCTNPIAELKYLTGRSVGINLEPVDTSQQLLENRVELAPGRQVSPQSLEQAQKLGVDFIVLTGNPAIGVSLAAISEAIVLAKQHFQDWSLQVRCTGPG